MRISFLGAAQNVTGSKHLVEVNNFRLLLDCGSYQGRRAQANKLNSVLPFDAKTIDAVVLSHAHIDHCGVLPILVRSGFNGKIYCTDATADIAKYMLEDSAKIQEQDAFYYNSNLGPGEEPIKPLYTYADVKKVFPLFCPTSYFRDSKQWTVISNNLRFKFYDAGHILGSAVTVLETQENNRIKTLAYTGDLGNSFMPILHNPENIQESIDVYVTESTYGDRVHGHVEDASQKIINLVLRVVESKGKIVIPSFSLGRTQELIYLIHKLVDEKKIPCLPIYVDSPLSTSISNVFQKYEKYFDQESWTDFFSRGKHALLFKDLHYVSERRDSIKLNDLNGPIILISASGMAEAGRVLHHLQKTISDPKNAILITGYQAENTLGRKIQTGEKRVRIYNRFYDVRARVEIVDELSAHADRNGLIHYLSAIQGLKKVFIVHGEVVAARSFEHLIKLTHPNLKVTTPKLNQVFEV